MPSSARTIWTRPQTWQRPRLRSCKRFGASSTRQRPRRIRRRGSARLAQAQTRFGGTAYTDADMVNLFNYAVRVPTPLLDNLCQVHFAVVPAALLRVRPVDFGALAKVDVTHPYVKVSVIISMYLGAIHSGGGSLRRQSGGVAGFAPGAGRVVGN